MKHPREVVVITGATAGVGRATVKEFACHGSAIGLVARGRDGLAAARRDVEAAGTEAVELPLDVADADAVEEAARSVEDRLGPIDVWVNNAMTTVFAPFHEVTAAEFRRATEVTYLGTVHGTMAALRRMRPRGRGVIVQVGSALAYRPIPLQAPYCGAKHAIRGFTDSVRSELLHDGIDVHLTAVDLPALNTPQFDWCEARLPRAPQPVPPIYQPEVAARAIYWAAHHRRREVRVGMPTVAAILANKVAPGLLDSYLGWTGYDSQQTDEPLPSGRKTNLFSPVEGDHGAHGRFGARAHERSVQLWANTHRGWIAAALSVVIGGTLWKRRA